MDPTLRQGRNVAMWLSQMLSSKPAHDLFALLVLAIAATGAYMGIDALMFTNSDTLYPVHIQYFGWLEYRPPPSNNLFPDVLMHSLVQIWTNDLLQQKLIVGALLFFLSSLVIGWTLGYTATLAFVAIYSVSGFYFFDSTAHFSLPMCMALVLWARLPALRCVILFVGVFSDLLLLLPLVALWIGTPVMRPDDDVTVPATVGSFQRSQFLVVIAAIALNILYAEFGTSAAVLLPLAAGFGGAVYVAARLGLSRAFRLAVIGGLVLLALLDLAPVRYALPVAASILLVEIATAPAGFFLNWRSWGRMVVLPAAYVVMLVMGLKTVNFERLSGQFDCLAQSLVTRNIQTVAAEHWTAKPLYFALLGPSGSPRVGITQIDFSTARYHLWMAPHSFYGMPTQWAVRNRYACQTFTSEARYCGQADTAPVVSLTPVCEVFDLVEYESAVPSVGMTAPANKVAAIYRQGMNYLDQVYRLVGP